MEGRLLLKDCSILATGGRLQAQMAVVVQGETITQVRASQELPSLPGDWVIGCQGRLVVPGWVDCHSHLVSSQLRRPLIDSARAASLLERMESQLAAIEVETLTAFSMARALRAGVTMIVEQLRCPNRIADGLSAQANTAQRLGARLVVSHAIGDVEGGPSAREQLEQSANWVRSWKKNSLVQPALGFQSLPEGDQSLLEQIGRLSLELNVGLHYRLDRQPLSQLQHPGILGPHAWAVVGPDVTPEALETLTRTGVGIALSFFPPKLAQTLIAAHAHLESAPLLGLCTAFGESWPNALSLAWAHLAGPTDLLTRVVFTDPAKFRSRCFGASKAAIEEGALADLVVYDTVPAFDAMGSALVSQLASSPVAWTIVAGKVVVREGNLLAYDYLELAREAAAALKSIWGRVGLA